MDGKYFYARGLSVASAGRRGTGGASAAVDTNMSHENEFLLFSLDVSEAVIHIQRRFNDESLGVAARNIVIAHPVEGITVIHLIDACDINAIIGPHIPRRL